MKRLPAVIVLAATAAILSPLATGDSGFPEPEGWKSAGEVLTFGRDNLWEYINGAADAFLAYGFLGLNVADLSSGDLQVTVEVYDMGTPLNAFGIFRAEFPAGTEKLAVGAEAALVPPYQCLLLKDSRYVKIEVLDGEVTPESGKKFLQALSAALPGPDGLPKPVLELPAEGKVAGSEAYASSSFLGTGDLKGAVHATYKDDAGKEYKAFLLIPGEDETAEELWSRLADRWQPVEREGAPVLSKRIPYSGTAGLLRTSDGILGVAGMPDTKALLERLDALSK
jgi:hypothetical protein